MCEGQAKQRPALATGQAFVGGHGLLDREFRAHIDERIERAGLDALQEMAGQFDGADLAGVQCLPQLADGLQVPVAHSITFGTR